MKQIDKVNESVETERYENIMDKLNEIVETLGCEGCALEYEVDEKDNIIENLCRSIDERNDRIEELENYLECAYKANKKLAKKIKKLKAKNKVLKTELEEYCL